MSALLNSLRSLAGSSSKNTTAGVSGARFGVTPNGGEGPGEGGYAEWHQAMRLVARLPAGVPHHFRRKLWLTLSERHLTARGVDWPIAERACFRGTAQPDDTELGAQIIKDLHRTGCSLFCGAEGRENQGMLRRVLLAYARWNKDVGYCQGFNMLAAIILEVMDKSEADSLKVMIYLVEAVLPEGYFADDLRGLSADMAAFRDLLKLRLPRLAQHMDCLQKISDGGGVEPPLPDVFTMQWFLTLYATWLPRDSLLRIWDLVLLDGNEVLLLTALAIWDLLQDRILSARSADEFYSCMGGGVGAVWEAGDSLVARVVAFGSAPELPKLRSFHRYRVAPPAPPITAPVFQPPLHSAVQSMTKRGLRLFYSEDEGDSSDDGNKMALATVIPRRETRSGTGDRLSLDIGALKRQYARLRERQRQAHVILAAACARHAAVGVPTSPTSLTVNSLLLGKSAIVSSRGRRLGPPPGAVPPSRQSRSHDKTSSRSRVRSTETISWQEEKSRKSLSRRNSVKWKDIKNDKSIGNIRKASIDIDEVGDGTIVSEIEANQMLAAMRSRSSSETSSYSSHSDSSTDTSLCDENEKGSDSDGDLPDDGMKNKNVKTKIDKLPTSPMPKDKLVTDLPISKDFKTTNPATTGNYEPTLNVVKDITDYLDSAAGEPLRTYIDEFDTKLKNNDVAKDVNSDNLKTSPLHQDLSDNTSPDPRSMPRSPDNESITVSEDEPPIQLKIDKYFEHSPEFFGARVTDPNNTDIPNRRSAKRLSRLPKKPESLTLQCNHSDKILKEEVERASSLPQSHSFTKIKLNDDFENNDVFQMVKPKTPESKKEVVAVSPKDFILRSGRKNSERALQIIQENSKILSRILTKQNTAETTASSEYVVAKKIDNSDKSRFYSTVSEKSTESKLVDSPLLKESISDSLIGCRKRNVSDRTVENHDFVRIRPISIDDPFSLESRNTFQRNEEFLNAIKNPSTDCLGNKTDMYGWVNKAFSAKCDRPLLLDKTEKQFDFDFKKQNNVPLGEDHISELKPAVSSEWGRHPFSGESRTSVTLPSADTKDTPTYGRRFTSGDCHHPLSNKYSDYVLSAASDICRKTFNEGSKASDNIQKTDESQASEFSQNVTSSISFTYEPSVDDDSLTGAKSNSSDTLCQIASLDQVSTPISPKMFPIKDTPTLPKDFVERSDKMRFESDDTCSAITSLLETDTLSSLSYPRSPSTGSYHPFPTRPVMRMPKEIGVKLGLYPKDTINSAPK